MSQAAHRGSCRRVHHAQLVVHSPVRHAVISGLGRRSERCVLGSWHIDSTGWQRCHCKDGADRAQQRVERPRVPERRALDERRRTKWGGVGQVGRCEELIPTRPRAAAVSESALSRRLGVGTGAGEGAGAGVEKARGPCVGALEVFLDEQAGKRGSLLRRRVGKRADNLRHLIAAEVQMDGLAVAWGKEVTLARVVRPLELACQRGHQVLGAVHEHLHMWKKGAWAGRGKGACTSPCAYGMEARIYGMRIWHGGVGALARASTPRMRTTCAGLICLMKWDVCS